MAGTTGAFSSGGGALGVGAVITGAPSCAGGGAADSAHAEPTAPIAPAMQKAKTKKSFVNFMPPPISCHCAP
ncbi:MAG: hypothetical protein ACR2OT_01640 [Parvibaculales bacterium]